jgi:CIC family chloride channel protein
LVVNVLEEMKVSDVMDSSMAVPTVPSSAGLDKIRTLLSDGHHPTVPVRDVGGAIVGLLTTEQLRPVLDDRHVDPLIVASDICAPPAWLYPDDDLARAHQLFQTCGCPQLPVLESAEKSNRSPIIGMLDYRALMLAFEREVARRRRA